MNNSLKNKNILITAGPTWVPIDKVRVITNVFGGNLGVEIAKNISKTGAKVTFLFGPGRAILPKESANLKIIKFKYYSDLLRLIKKEIGSKKYDIVIHSAAVADYIPTKTDKGKIKSGQQDLSIQFKPTKKIVDLIKKIDPKIFLVKFKLEVGVSEKKLIDIAYNSMLQSKADLIVANEFSSVFKDHKAFIIDTKKNIVKVSGKGAISTTLIKEMISHLK
ncbi:MAG: hypothetical protein A2556_00510 [Candidatus Vogelbacteria bacterium RIFOXYD2_FULL_44_9]|uniref:Phosphopantothenoylcysteine synthase/decarboxylase n=2 Tax=Patescibacteria group TaxID=1783273 RepID=A0A0G0X3M3_9BACT|nr:MAG: Phosphopantothenoylcysteine synthase/decarboxylase [Candidatus Woesebacteria bacterium GW2011_GWA1_41_13b]OHA60870.1 MAG: hypothetical protein A2556_00510 [Candidatus Vogelbacteria bacterium RIFOXYD2_FULL_44_9]